MLTAPRPRLLVTPDLHPGYRLRGFLGSGGFGEVWAAQDAGGKPAALKFLRCRVEDQALCELRAVQLVLPLRHPHLTRLDRVWAVRDCLVVAMELADGSLADLAEAYRAEFGAGLPAAALGPLFAQAATALDFLNTPGHTADGQRAGIQHCDVSPGNLLLFGETLKLSDFGLASALSGRFREHRRAGKPAYAAPEVFQGRLSDRTDQYALAVSYCMLRGATPFSNPPATFQRGYRRPPPDLSLLAPGERLAVARALAPAPQDRWPSCAAFAAALARSIAGSGVERRLTPRYPPAPGVSCAFPAVSRGTTPSGQVLDISAGGVRVLLAGSGVWPEPGRVLPLLLANPVRGYRRLLQLRPVRYQVLRSGDLVVGGAFAAPLGRVDLDALAAGK
jgi:serine/threonine protein kinase, bacterial